MRDERTNAYYKSMPRFAPRRAYSGSMVPLRTGGYTPNRVERKVNDITTTIYQVNLTGSITLLANPQLGSDFNQRIGRKIVLKSVYIRGACSVEAASTQTIGFVSNQLIRFIVFADMQPNGAAPNISDVLAQAVPTSQLNMDNRDRFKIYSVREYVFDPWFRSAGGDDIMFNRTCYPIKKYKKLNLEVIYNGTNGGTIADINSGALYMLWLGSQTAGTGADSIATLSTRVRYDDA